MLKVYEWRSAMGAWALNNTGCWANRLRMLSIMLSQWLQNHCCAKSGP
jgi:hypothetical protein